MQMNEHIIIFYVLISVGRTLFWVVRVNGCVRFLLLLLLTVLTVSLSCACGDRQAVLAPTAASLSAIIAAVAGASLYGE
jgi:hypothetical protein